MKLSERTRGEGHFGQVVHLLSWAFIFLFLLMLNGPKKWELFWVPDICHKGSKGIVKGGVTWISTIVKQQRTVQPFKWYWDLSITCNDLTWPVSLYVEYLTIWEGMSRLSATDCPSKSLLVGAKLIFLKIVFFFITSQCLKWTICEQLWSGVTVLGI